MTVSSLTDSTKSTCANTVSCGNLFVTVFAKPYLDSIPNSDKLHSSNNFHHRNAISRPAARDGANTAPYRLATVTTPCQQTGQATGWLRR